MRKLFTAVALVGVLLLAFATPAFAWHITDAKAHCDSGQHNEQGIFLHVGVKLSDAGPGTYVDTSGNSGTFGNVKNIEYDTPTFAFPLTVTVDWYTGEHSSVTIQEVDGCQDPTTTTTEVTTSTTSPSTSTSTTVPESTTSVSTTSVPDSTTTSTVPESTTSTTSPPTTTTQPEETTVPTTTTQPPSTTTTAPPTTTTPTSTTNVVPPTSTTAPATSTTTEPKPPLPHTGGDSGLLAACGFLILAVGVCGVLFGTKRPRPGGPLHWRAEVDRFGQNGRTR